MEDKSRNSELDKVSCLGEFVIRIRFVEINAVKLAAKPMTELSRNDQNAIVAALVSLIGIRF